MAEKNPWPGTYEVVNTGKRSRTRNGVRFPGNVQGKEYEPVVVEVSSRAEWLRLKGCKDLKVKSTGKKANAGDGDEGGGDELDKLTVPELDEQLQAAELSTEGNKPDKVARLREHLITLDAQ